MLVHTHFKVVSINAVCWITLGFLIQSVIEPSESLPVGALPKGGEWAGSGSEDDSEVEQTYGISEDEIYRRLTTSRVDRSAYKKDGAYLITGRLYNRNGYVLRINMDGTVEGTTDKNSPLAQLEFHSVGTGLLMILGVTSQRYLSIGDTGLLQGTEEPSLNTVFQEVHEANMYHTYSSFKHYAWLVGIKKNGKPKRGPSTRVGQKSTQFLITYH